MNRLACFTLVAVAALIGCIGQVAVAADGEPVTIEAIRQMRRERMPVKQIYETIEKRGLGFAVDTAAERQLRSIGFNAKMIGQMKGMKSADAAPAAGAVVNAPAAPAAGPSGRPAGIRRELDAATEQDYAAMAERIKKTIATSNTAVAASPTKHINLLANPKVTVQMRPVVEDLEKMVADRFPEPIASGVDPRCATIVLLESRYEYESWIKALFKVHEQSGLKFQGQDPLRSALATNAIFTPGAFSVCLEGMDAEGARRRVAFAVGYQYIRQLTNEHSPDAIQTGFGNVTEAMMFKDPVSTVVSGYVDRQLDPAHARWLDVVRQRFAQKQNGSFSNVLAYSTQAMSVDQYAEAWTFTALLASEPRNFCELVNSLGKGTPANTAITDIYGVKEDSFMKHWTQFVLGGN